jgi:rSAM/selenodomain-associated transferase 1
MTGTHLPELAPEPPLAIAVFAKAPVPGQAKTRLIPLLGADGAAHLQAQLLDAALAKATALAGAACTLWVAGALDHPAIATAAARYAVTLEAQHGADLGARMHAAIAHTLGSKRVGSGKCLLIGTDCPALTTAHLAQAAAALATHDVVLGPADDGGYVLIGMRQPQATLFKDIAWGSSTVLQATRARIASARLRVFELPSLPDLDTPEDFRHAQVLGWVGGPGAEMQLPK